MVRVLYPRLFNPLLPVVPSPGAWAQPTARPTHRKILTAATRAAAGVAAGAPLTALPAALASATWGQPPTQPTPRTRLPPGQQTVFSPLPEAVTIDRWWTPQIQPTAPRGLLAAIQTSAATSPIFVSAPVALPILPAQIQQVPFRGRSFHASQQSAGAFVPVLQAPRGAPRTIVNWLD